MGTNNVDMDDIGLKYLQNKELQILKELKRICEKHNIEYFLIFGTLLGAVRHKGFIPWDDDIDVGMTYDDLVKFRNVCKTELKEPFFLQNCYTEPDAHLTFDKLRLSNTTLIARNMSNKDINHGIDIDIYPLYNIPDNWIKRKIQYAASLLYLLLEVGETPEKTGWVTRNSSKLILSIIGGRLRERIKNKCHGLMRKYESIRCNNKALLFGNPVYCKKIYPSSCFEKCEKMQFEDDLFSVPQGYDLFLKRFYGDYMKLPPESERGVKLDNLLKVDTENSYLKYKGVYYCK